MSGSEVPVPPLRVTFVLSGFDPEPGVQHGLPLARWLMGRGHKVQVLTTFPQWPHGRVYPGYKVRPRFRETMDGVPVLRVPTYPSHDLSPARRIATYLSFAASASLLGVPAMDRADVIFLFEPPPTDGVPALLLKLLHGTPIVQHVADMWPETVVDSGMLRGAVAKRVVGEAIGAYCRFQYRQAAHVSVLSPGFKRLLVERGVPAEKVTVVYNWADEKLFRPVPRDPELRRAMGLPDKFTLMYAGNLGPMQQVETLVHAAARLRGVADLQLAIVGTGPTEDVVRQAIHEANASNVVMVPRQSYAEMARVHALADALVVHLRDYPFLRATIPSKTAVSMACGRPILMAVRGDAADLVARAGCGVLAAPEDPASIAEAMLSLHRMGPELREELGGRGRTFYLEHLALDASATAMEQLFSAAASGRHAGARSSLPSG